MGPSAQEHPDYYVRIVEERDGGIVVRGAKVHTSLVTNANELIVLPTRVMKPGDEAYAVSFALPVNTPGLKLIASPHGSEPKDPIEHPISGRRKMMETLTVFDDVFIPRDRIFLKGEIEYAGLLAINFVRFHRFTAVSYKLPLLELLAGAAYAVAEANGIISCRPRARKADPIGGLPQHRSRAAPARRDLLHYRAWYSYTEHPFGQCG